MYYPYLQVPDPDVRLIESSMRLVIRSRLAPSTLVGAVKQAVEVVNKETPIYDVRTMDEIVSASMAGREFNTALLGIFALLALAMALAGVYAVMSYAVSRQTHEFGIRMALGAGRGDVLKLVFRQGMIIAAVGGGVGLAGALGLTRFMASLLYGVKPTDTVSFAAAAAVVVGVALVASYVPARRATKVDPMVALRYE
jgi:putative ABC transport system permease protein